MKSIKINKITEEMKEVTIDIRETNEYKNGHIKGIKNIPMTGLLMNPHVFLKKDKTYYIMCQAGGRSAMAVKRLNKQGYNLVNLKGGYKAWKTKG